jgi:hypothetical protein
MRAMKQVIRCAYVHSSIGLVISAHPQNSPPLASGNPKRSRNPVARSSSLSSRRGSSGMLLNAGHWSCSSHGIVDRHGIGYLTNPIVWLTPGVRRETPVSAEPRCPSRLFWNVDAASIVAQLDSTDPTTPWPSARIWEPALPAGHALESYAPVADCSPRASGRSQGFSLHT